jgi:hypothetical protein
MARKLPFIESDKPKYLFYTSMTILTITVFLLGFPTFSLSVYDINTGQILNNDDSRADGITHKDCFGGGYVTETTVNGITTTTGNCDVISAVFTNPINLLIISAIIIVSIIMVKRRQN